MTGGQQSSCQALTGICRAQLGINRDLEGRASSDASLDAKFPGRHGGIVADSGSPGYM